jgi:hypothetical protein
LRKGLARVFAAKLTLLNFIFKQMDFSIGIYAVAEN